MLLLVCVAAPMQVDDQQGLNCVLSIIERPQT
jgi:hypothetical protein